MVHVYIILYISTRIIGDAIYFYWPYNAGKAYSAGTLLKENSKQTRFVHLTSKQCNNILFL